MVDGNSESLMKDQRVWSVAECAEMFSRSVTELKQQLVKSTVTSESTKSDSDSEPPAMLVWDKVRLMYSHDFSSLAGFPRLLESPGFFSCKFQDLESLGD